MKIKKERLIKAGVIFLSLFILFQNSGVLQLRAAEIKASNRISIVEKVSDVEVAEESNEQGKEVDITNEESSMQNDTGKLQKQSLSETENLGNEPPEEVDVKIIMKNGDGSFTDTKTGELISSNRISYVNPVDLLSKEIWVRDEETGIYEKKKIADLTDAEKEKYADQINMKAARAGVTVSAGNFTGYSMHITAADGVHSQFSQNYQTILIDGEFGFCVQPGYELIPGSNFSANPYMQHQLSIIAYEGWEKSNHTVADYMATQFMIWEYLGATINSTSFSDYSTYKATIQNRIKHHNDKPSFSNSKYEINVGETITIHDANKVLNQFHITSTDGLTVSIKGNDLLITGTANAKDNSVIILDKFEQNCVGTPMVYSNGSQDVAKFKLIDPLDMRISVKVNKQGTITASKTDMETGLTVQGDASLSGWVFGVYTDAAKTNKVDTLISTDKNEVKSKLLDFATYYVFEEKAPEGYVLSDQPQIVVIGPDNLDAQIQLPNRVKSQAFELIKVTTDGSSGEISTVAGAEFTIKLQSDVEKYGSWEAAPIAKNASGQPAALLVTDAKGYALSEELPFGTYIVRETKVPENLTPIPDFVVKIDEDSRTPQIWRVFNDAPFEAILKVVKIDEETGKPITLSNATFKIKNLQTGEYLTQWIWYPIPHKVEEFTTSEDGTFMTPSALEPGKWQLEEIGIPEGYLTLKDPVVFEIGSAVEIETAEDGKTPVIKIEVSNKPIKGQISLKKEAEIFKGYDFRQTEYGTLYEPIFEKGILPGVTYRLTAAEDIITNDGTKWYAAGDLVEEFTTTDIEYLSQLLPLGHYQLQEISTIYDNYIVDDTIYDIYLTAEDEVTPIVLHEAERWNDRHKGTLSFTKELEESPFIDKEDAARDVIFGLYTAEPIIANGAEVLPADALIAVTGLDRNFKGSFDLDFAGSYYVQELATNNHYQLNAEKFYFDFVYGKDVNVSIELDQPILNTLKHGKVEIVKTSNEPYPFIQKVNDIPDYVASLEENKQFYLQGIEFEIAKDKEFKEVVAKGVTDENGYVSFDLPLGKAYLRESKCLDGFVLDTTIYEIEITEEGQLLHYDMVNEVRRSSIAIYKEDKFTHRRLPNAEFTLFADPACTIELEKAVSQEDGIARFDNLLNGVYYGKETGAPEGFLLSNEVVKIVINTNEPPKTYKIVYYNTMLPSFSIPQTGSGIELYVCLSVFVISGCILILTNRKKK